MSTPLRVALGQGCRNTGGPKNARSPRSSEPWTLHPGRIRSWRWTVMKAMSGIGWGGFSRSSTMPSTCRWARCNAGVKEKFFASASSTPRRIFPSILRMSQNHLSDARKDRRRRGSRANHTDSEIKQVMDGLDAHMPFPTTLSLDDQGRFIVGFYHQRPTAARREAGCCRPY